MPTEYKDLTTEVELKYAFKIRPVSWGTAKQLSINVLRLNRARESNDPALLAEAFDLFQKELAKLVISVPADALVEGSPKDLRWSDPASFDWLREDAMNELVAYVNGERATQSAKN